LKNTDHALGLAGWAHQRKHQNREGKE